MLFEAQDGYSWALALVSHAALLLAQPRDLQLFKESSHQVEKQRPYLPYHVASRQFNTRATQLPPALTSCRVLQSGGLGDGETGGADGQGHVHTRWVPMQATWPCFTLEDGVCLHPGEALL